LPENFSTKLERAFSTFGQLCVGIDPHASLLIENGLDDSLEGLDRFSRTVLEHACGLVGIIKYQVSFYERFGPEGLMVLQQQLRLAKDAGLLVIADAKRGDIGSTMEAYSEAWLGKDAAFLCDALTVSSFLGVGALEPAISAAVERGKGLFVLCATSNPEARLIQQSRNQSVTVSGQVAAEVERYNKLTSQSNSKFGSIGLVVGATIDLQSQGLESLNSQSKTLRSPILAPGFGAQGVHLSQAKAIFPATHSDTIFSISRSVLRDGLSAVRNSIKHDSVELAQALER